MGEESVEGSKMGTSFIIYAALIGLAILAFTAAKYLVGSGTNEIQNNAQAVEDSVYDDYNAKPVSGTGVKTALETFKGHDIMILVHTLCEGDEGGNFIGAVNVERNAGDKIGFTATDKNPWRVVRVDGFSADSNYGVGMDKGPGDNGAYFINYGAVAANGKDVHAKKGSGMFIYDGDFFEDKNTGEVIHNVQTKYIGKRGSAEYISDDGLFDANLIKDQSGEITGIMFSQVYREK